MRWTVNHVKEWLEWAVGEYTLYDVINIDKFPLVNGRELCNMSRDQFVKSVGSYEAADKLLHHLEYLRECKSFLSFKIKYFELLSQG